LVTESDRCAECGSCCKYIELDFAIGIFTLEKAKDIIKWLALHNVMYDSKRDKLLFPLKCLMLQNNRCIIYETRPQICRDFKVDGELCQKAKQIVKML
jgi:Fe-S-cluster containining protein